MLQKNKNSPALIRNVFVGILATPTLAMADFLSDGKAQIEVRNYYFNRDFRQPGGSVLSGQSKAEEWGQGFILRAESGYTDGTVKFGIDAIGMAGFKLDSSRDRAGTALFPTADNGESHNEYSKLGVTAKAKVSSTSLKAGALIFRNQMLLSPDGRLLPQMFRGVMLESEEIKGLSIQAAHITDSMPSQSTRWDKMSAVRIGGEAGSYSFYGGDYHLQENSTVGMHYGKLDGIYQQLVANANISIPIQANKFLKFDLRYAVSKEDGAFRDIDNRAFGSMVTYTEGAHSIGIGYQKMFGDDPYPYVANSDAYLVNFIQISDFANVNEQSWQARYDFDLAAKGIPGLKFMMRYVRGDLVDLPGGGRGNEWERDADITYVIQSGVFKNLSLRWRNAKVRSTFGNDIDENRLILQYVVPLF
ncbi:OprD family porin [Pseudomonas putida]|uniref:OprD family porin n=1 Tax=Pseudomonas putida TaxID=303 RepID=UPI0018AA61BB|nr:OprD family porin [Pseudomonas putida]MBF8668350.1 OprD family porin [Pseudomonas putida]MBF8710831.1 OprD family porin [Pseudomonas putida]